MDQLFSRFKRWKKDGQFPLLAKLNAAPTHLMSKSDKSTMVTFQTLFSSLLKRNNIGINYLQKSLYRVLGL